MRNFVVSYLALPFRVFSENCLKFSSEPAAVEVSTLLLSERVEFDGCFRVDGAVNDNDAGFFGARHRFNRALKSQPQNARREICARLVSEITRENVSAAN